MEYVIVSVFVLAAVILGGILPVIREIRCRQFKKVFGFDQKMADKYGRRILQGLTKVQSTIERLRYNRDQARIALDGVCLTDLKENSGDALASCERNYRQALTLARSFRYISYVPRAGEVAPTVVFNDG